MTVISSCSSPEPQASKTPSSPTKLQVLCTNGMIHDLVSSIGGSRISSTSLINPSIDPHSYEMKKGDDEKFLQANIVFYNGLGLEHSPSLYAHLMQHPHAFSLGGYLEQTDPTSILEDNGQVDPHIWLDVLLWSQLVHPIATELSLADPAGQTYYEEQANATYHELQQLHHFLLQNLNEIKPEQKYLVSSHDAFNYFARRYLTHSSNWKNHFCAPEGLAPDGQLSFHDLKRVVDYIYEHQITTIFSEINVSQDSLKKVVDVCRFDRYPVKIYPSYLFSDTIGSHGSYDKMMRHNVLTLCTAWKNHGSD